MNLITLEDKWASEFFEPPKYRKDAPVDRALIVSDGTRAVCLDHIGPALDYWFENCGDEDFQGIPAGVWIWEGTVRTHTDHFGEHDSELEGEERPLTEDEWLLFRDEQQGPWDPYEWIIKPDEIPINPGIVKTVAALNAAGFKTTDSGDGETHAAECDRDVGYVVIRLYGKCDIIGTAHAVAEELKRLGAPLDTGDGTGVLVQAMYSPLDGVATVDVSQIHDRMLTLLQGCDQCEGECVGHTEQGP